MSTTETKPTKEYKGVPLYVHSQPHGKASHKIMISFPLNGIMYDNGAVMPNTASLVDDEAAVADLIKWAETVINENKVDKKK